MKTSRKLCPRWAEFNGGLAETHSVRGSLAMGSVGSAVASPFTMPMLPPPPPVAANAGSPPAPAPIRPAFKFKMGGPKPESVPALVLTEPQVSTSGTDVSEVFTLPVAPTPVVALVTPVPAPLPAPLPDPVAEDPVIEGGPTRGFDMSSFGL